MHDIAIKLKIAHRLINLTIVAQTMHTMFKKTSYILDNNDLNFQTHVTYIVVYAVCL